eukprot:1553851-Pleurochrysis_carterae.AAC.2
MQFCALEDDGAMPCNKWNFHTTLSLTSLSNASTERQCSRHYHEQGSRQMKSVADLREGGSLEFCDWRLGGSGCGKEVCCLEECGRRVRRLFASQEYRSARTLGVPVVSTIWVMQCEESGERANEVADTRSAQARRFRMTCTSTRTRMHARTYAPMHTSKQALIRNACR